MNIYRQIIDNVFEGKRLSWDVLRQCPEFDVLYGNWENQAWHCEGTTDKHLNLMLNLLFGEFKSQLTQKEFILVYLAILWHDIRKPQSKSIGNDGLIHNYGHERLSSCYFRDFLQQAYGDNITDLNYYRELWNKVISFCFFHMEKKLDFYTTNRAKYCLGCVGKENFNAFATLLHIDSHGAINDAVNPTRDEYLSAFKFFDGQCKAPELKKEGFSLSLCIGASASGKSTYAKQFGELTKSMVVNTDQIREEILGNVNDQTQNGRIFDIARRRVNDFLGKKQSVIVDATNMTYKDRNGFINIGNKYSVPILAHVFLTPLSKCIERNSLRERKVPEEIIKRQYERMEPASYFEFHAITTHF